MTSNDFTDIDTDDLGDLLEQVEASFGIKFLDNELVDILTFGQLCDHISEKIQLENLDDCTNQQGFYKLRVAMYSTLSVGNQRISTNTNLAEILPGYSRRYNLKKLEEHLGLKLNILRPPHWLYYLLMVFFVGSLVGIFIMPQIALITAVLSLLGFRLAYRFGKELDLTTVGELAEKMVRENYLMSRRNPDTFNKSEIEKVLIRWFSSYFDIDKIKLTRDATFE